MTHQPRPGRQDQATQQKPMATCPACGKQAYTSKATAKAGARLLYPGRRMRVYQCPGTPWWHLTSQNAKRAAAWRNYGTGKETCGG